ncbi:winged helix-turn-helix domain-containing protein [Pseudarthrobacter sp. IC2-21]|uniref:winged helix-turn-helix domain-containing protein n=1 Tax=Pseudarthrobacter sp. IC2-21 TaxID=3092262 RepID=UPI0039BCC9AB
MNKTRSRIVRFLLRNGPSSCGTIGTNLHTSPSNVRRHLHLLRDAGLVQHSSAKFSASPEHVQRYVGALAAGFHVSVMPPQGPVSINHEQILPFGPQLGRRTS